MSFFWGKYQTLSLLSQCSGCVAGMPYIVVYGVIVGALHTVCMLSHSLSVHVAIHDLNGNVFIRHTLVVGLCTRKTACCSVGLLQLPVEGIFHGLPPLIPYDNIAI